MISLTVTLALTSEGHINKCPTSTFIDGIFKSWMINDEMIPPLDVIMSNWHNKVGERNKAYPSKYSHSNMGMAVIIVGK